MLNLTPLWVACFLNTVYINPVLSANYEWMHFIGSWRRYVIGVIFFWIHFIVGGIQELQVSPDGNFVACKYGLRGEGGGYQSRSAIQIWCRDQLSPLARQRSENQPPIDDWVAFDLGHPEDVISFSWRRASTFLPP